MILASPIRPETEETAPGESPDHEWAEFNRPAELLPGFAGDNEDATAFLGVTLDVDADLPDGQP